MAVIILCTIGGGSAHASHEQELWSAATYGHFATVKRLVEQGADINRTFTSCQHTALTSACGKGHYEIVKYLVSKGARIEPASSRGLSPLIEAAGSGQLEIVKYLLDRGAQINKRAGGGTAIHSAAIRGHDSLVWFLLSKGASVDHSDLGKDTLIHDISRSSGNVALIREFVKRGVPLQAKDTLGYNALMYAARGGNAHTIQFLIEKGVRPDLCEILYHFMKNDRKKSMSTVELLVSSGVPLMDKWGNGPLHFAAQADNIPAFNHFLSKGYDINTLSKQNRTPIFAAVEYKSWNIAKYLVDKGVKINIQDNSGKTVLMNTVQKKNYPFAKYLLDKGADSSLIDRSYGFTAWHYAYNGGDSDIINLFHTNDAQELRMRMHYRALRGISKGNPEGVMAYLSGGGGINDLYTHRGKNSFLLEAVENGQEDIAERLIAKGADVNAQNRSGVRPLHEACFKGSIRMAGMLIGKGASVKVHSNNGSTPLHKACYQRENLELISLLLHHGADINAVDKYFQATPLNYSCYMRSGGNLAVVRLLVEKGANVNIPDKKGYTPLDYAVKYRKTGVIEFLRSKGAVSGRR